MQMPTPNNKKLYAAVKLDADAKFTAPTSAYKSAWIVREYKKRGGTYLEDQKAVQPVQSVTAHTGLKRWFKEKWVDLMRPNNQPCGRHASNAKTGAYPLCRPSIRVTKQTPITVGELSKAEINRAKKQKQALKETGRIAPFKKNRK